MIIRKGNALKEHAKAVITETRFTKKDLIEDRILLLEGPDDIEVITNFYLYKGKDVKKNFRLVKANDRDIDDSSPVAGKQNALKLFTRLKQESRNVICLLDRDYDFHLGEKVSDHRVIYYDYFELENYIFEEKVFKIIVKNICNYPDDEYYKKIISIFQKIEESCKPYILLCFLREVHFRKDVLTDQQLEKILQILKIKPESMMQMKHLPISDPLKRIECFIQMEIEKVGLNLDLIQDIINRNHYVSSSIMDVSDPLNLFRYAIKGKVISNSLQFFFKYILEENPYLYEIKSEGNLYSVLTRLKLEWIPNISQDFSRLLENIEKKFGNEEFSTSK
ncbi:DUF4435 domain-containing protein [Cytobacillus firmus]|uniref:DUF4435 domain-containing protein n=1 Tax=Cytobacillus firmus TaxID=1399 RepID=UPI002163114F|nr:DUF4435 domain-containing protein [Cytobacillus firmus]MCS0674639.1 hypothetical protein [Cytobacillus firmus]